MPQEIVTSWNNTDTPQNDSSSDIKTLSIEYFDKSGKKCEEKDAWAAKTSDKYYVSVESGGLSHKERSNVYYQSGSNLKLVNEVVYSNYMLYLSNALETSYAKATSEYQLQGFSK